MPVHAQSQYALPNVFATFLNLSSLHASLLEAQTERRGTRLVFTGSMLFRWHGTVVVCLFGGGYDNFKIDLHLVWAIVWVIKVGVGERSGFMLCIQRRGFSY